MAYRINEVTTAANHMRGLVAELQDLEEKLRLGGGPAQIEKQHQAGKLTARERVAKLIDAGTMFLETGLLMAYDKYDGQAPAAGVMTGVGLVEGRPIVIVANDATVKAGAWWPETIPKILRAQEIAMRNRLPIVYLVDSAGVNLPYQEGIFPGQYGARRIVYYNSLMRRKLQVPLVAERFKGVAPAKPAEGLYDLLPADHRLPYNVEEVIARIVDADEYLEFQPGHAPELLCANARLNGQSIG